jgi:signal transduction histidine kinase
MRLPRLPWLTPARFDQILAAVMLVLAELQVLFLGSGSRQWMVAGSAALVTGGIALRRQHPFLVGIGTQSVLVATQYLQLDDFAGPVTVGWFCALYALAVWTTLPAFVVGMAWFVASDLVPSASTGDVQSIWNFTAVVALVMLFVRVIVTSRDRRLALAQRERDLAAREAVIDERARIARELHDVIAHHVSTMVVQAGAERRMLDPSQKETTEVLGTIENVGRSALAEMRRMVTILRQGRTEGLAPQPTLADVPLLVDQMQRAGLAVELRESGTAGELPVGLELSAYRIIQEALTNALKHAGEEAHVLVSITHDTDGLELVVEDDGRAAVDPGSGGHGLVGMRERVAMYGGRLEAGRQAGGGFGVRVCLPTR